MDESDNAYTVFLIFCERLLQAIYEDVYLILALRYKELFGGDGGGGVIPDIPFEIDGYLTQIDTGHWYGLHELTFW